MFKLTPRYKLWNMSVWFFYCVLGGLLFATDTLSKETTAFAQVALYFFLSLPGFYRRLDTWLNQPRVEELRLLGRLFTA